MREFLGGKVQLHAGDCREVVASLADASVDSCVCDPPYALVSIGKRFGADDAKPAKAGVYARGAGFMGKKWDNGEAAFAAEFWAQVYRALKPGGYVLAFSGTRTYHRLACAVEDAEFEIRDQIGWAYGSGFPKSHNRVIDGVKWGTALKPAWEPIVMARKPLIGTVAENVLEHGTGALNIDGCRIAAADGDYDHPGNDLPHTRRDDPDWRMPMQQAKPSSLGRWPANIIHDGSDEVLAAFPAESKSGGDVASPPSNKAVGIYGDFSGDGRRFHGHADSGSAARFFYTAKADADDRLGSKHPTVKPLDLMQYLVRLVTPICVSFCPQCEDRSHGHSKTSSGSGAGLRPLPEPHHHEPTCKVCGHRLEWRPGVCLDPFAGTGTTGEAAWREGMRAILIEREPEYQADIARRMELAENPTKRSAVAASKNKLQGAEGTPLFGGVA